LPQPFQDTLKERRGDGFRRHARIDPAGILVQYLAGFHHRRVRRRHIEAMRYRVGQHGFDAAPGIDHGPIAAEIFFVKTVGHADQRGDGDGVIVTQSLLKQNKQPVDAPAGTHRPSRGGGRGRQFQRRFELVDAGAIEPIGGPRGVHRVQHEVLDHLIRLGIKDDHHAIRPHRLEPDGPHQQPAQDAALHIIGVGRQFVDVAGVHHIRMGDQLIAAGRQELCRRGRIPRMAPDLRTDAGRHHIDGGELPGGCAVPPPQCEYGLTVVRDGNIRTD